jgi:hypothetical protein
VTQNLIVLVTGRSVKKMSKIPIGLSMVFTSVILGGLLFLKSYHNVYWSHPAIFILLTIIGVFCASYGSFLLGNSWLATGESKRSLAGLLTILGAIIALGGVLLGLAAIALAIAISGTGYWGSAPYDYSGDYLIMGWQILALRLSILPGIVGGFGVGLGLRRKGVEHATKVV